MSVQKHQYRRLFVPLLLFFILFSTSISFGQKAEEPLLHTDTLQLHFRQGQTVLDAVYQNNREQLDTFVAHFEKLHQNPEIKVRDIRVSSFASPEGSLKTNKRISSARAKAVIDFMEGKYSLQPSLFQVVCKGANWRGVLELVERSTQIPNHLEVLNLLRQEVPDTGSLSESSDQRLKQKLSKIGGGKAWSYMYRTIFPELRTVTISISYETVQKTESPKSMADEVEQNDTLILVQRDTTILVERDTVFVEREEPASPFYMSLRTNLLTDIALVPNVAIEFNLGKGYALVAGWSYAWWHQDPKHLYWRMYGGDLELRKYFGAKASEKPLQGHHLGLYGQWYSWDFELGQRAYKSDKGTWTIGIGYGYSLPIGKHFNLDLGIGIGYLNGEYEEGLPDTSTDRIRYIWQSTNRLSYFGPTKVGVTLTWLLGRGNYNKRNKR